MADAPIRNRPGTTDPTGLPSDVVVQSYKRLQTLTLVYATVYLIAVFFVPDSPGTDQAFDQAVAHRFSIVFIAAALGSFLVINRNWLPPAWSPIAPLVFHVVGAVGIEFRILTWQGDLDVYRFVGLSWTAVWIVSLPLFVPTPPRSTAIASILAATALPAMWGIVALGDLPLPESATLAQMIVPNYLSVGIAVLASHVVYGLGRDIAEARRMGSYRLQETLGEGGMGEVWKADHLMLARPAAVKLVRRSLTEDPGILERFEREVQATAQLRSPHTIAIYDYGMSPEGVFYYVMELLEGLDLERLVRRHGTLAPARVVRILKQACHSLAEAHEGGIVHRDIKPANLFLCRYGRDLDFTKVLDFGLVKQSRPGRPENLSLTQVGSFTGTPAYSSPEMSLGRTEAVDQRTDIYSLGCVAFWLLTGRTLFEATTTIEMLMKHGSERPEPPSRYAEHVVSPRLDAIIMECVAKAPAERIQSALDLSGRLEEVEAEDPWSREAAARWWDAHRPSTHDLGRPGGHPTVHRDPETMTLTKTF